MFEGKRIDFSDVTPFAIVKGGANGKANAIDAISGATMTSNGVSDAINNWINAYKGFLSSAKDCCGEHEGEHCGDCENEGQHEAHEGEHCDNCENEK